MGDIRLVSVTADGDAVDDLVFGADVSADGTHVGFVSNTAIDPNDDNEFFDAYVSYLETGRIQAASVGQNGEFPVYGNVISTPAPFLSGDGRLVAFSTTADNLVAGDANLSSDVFVRDLELGTTVRVTDDDVPRSGSDRFLNSAEGISDDGTKVLITTYSASIAGEEDGGASDVVVADLSSGTFELVSTGVEENATASAFSGDGTVVGFFAFNPDFSPGAPSFFYFVKDLETGATQEAQGEIVALSFDGGLALVLDYSDNSSLSLLDTDAGTSEPLLGSARVNQFPALSGDGDIVAFGSEAPDLVAGDRNDSADVFILDREQDRVVRVNLDEDGREAEEGSDSGSPDLSFDGRVVAFATDARLTDDDPDDGEFRNDVYAVTLDAFAVADEAEAIAGDRATLDVLANDYDVDGDALSLVSFTEVDGVTVERDDNGTPGDSSDDRLTVTADADVSGLVSFAYTIEDEDGNQGTAAVDLFVRGLGASGPFPDLAEKRAVAPELIDGVDPNLLVGDGSSEVVVTFVSETAAFNNSLGFYTVADDGAIVAPEFLFTDVNGTAFDPARPSVNDGLGPLSPGDEVSLGVLEDGERFNLFVLQDGAGRNEELRSGDILGNDYSPFFGDETGEGLTVFGSDPNLSFLYEEIPGSEEGDIFEAPLSGDVFHAASYVPDQSRNPLNTRGELQALSGFDEEGRLLIAFEDKTRAFGESDDDFNDVVVAVELRDPLTGERVPFFPDDTV